MYAILLIADKQIETTYRRLLIEDKQIDMIFLTFSSKRVRVTYCNDSLRQRGMLGIAATACSVQGVQQSTKIARLDWIDCQDPIQYHGLLHKQSIQSLGSD